MEEKAIREFLTAIKNYKVYLDGVIDNQYDSKGEIDQEIIDFRMKLNSLAIKIMEQQ